MRWFEFLSFGPVGCLLEVLVTIKMAKFWTTRKRTSQLDSPSSNEENIVSYILESLLSEDPISSIYFSTSSLQSRWECRWPHFVSRESQSHVRKFVTERQVTGTETAICPVPDAISTVHSFIHSFTNVHMPSKCPFIHSFSEECLPYVRHC